MEIKRIAYPVYSLGAGGRAVIWTVGCNRRCNGCIAENLQNTDEACQMDVGEIVAKIKGYKKSNPDLGVTISGGEPFLQNDLPVLLKEINLLGIEDVLVYTGYTYEELQTAFPDFKNEYENFIGVLVDGRYVEELNDNKPLRGSSNQRIIFFKEFLMEKYADELKGQRKFNFETGEDGMLDIYGIPPKGFLENMQKNCLKKGVIYTRPKNKI